MGRYRRRFSAPSSLGAAAALLVTAVGGFGASALLGAGPAGASVRPAVLGELLSPPTDSGPVYAWGNGIDGEIGNGTTPAAQSVPTSVPLPAGVTALQVAGGAQTSYALGSDGNVYAWGNGTDGELGNDTTTYPQDTAVTVDLTALGGAAPVAIAAGTDMAYILDANGNVWAFGADGSGELGDGGAGGQQLSPVQVNLFGDPITAIAAGSTTGYALDQSGFIWSWGYGVDGELGNGTSGPSDAASTPTLVFDPTGALFTASAIAANLSDGYAIGTDGLVYSWGDNSVGQLGDGGAEPNSAFPVAVDLPIGFGATSIAAGSQTGYVLDDASGTAYSWGFGMNGELGDGAVANSSVPEPVTEPPGVTFLEITGGYANGYAIGDNQDVYTWGYDGEGELGNGTVDPNAYATPVLASISGINPGDPPMALGPEPMADTALLIGEGSPTVVVPEAPLPALLPLTALFAVVGVVVVRRRRTARAV